MLDLVDVLSLDQEGFQARFRETPLWRAKRGGLLRNAAVVLGNLRAAAAVPALKGAAQDEDPLVREHAVWALSQISSG
jgi:epoxyqueuosine reductase